MKKGNGGLSSWVVIKEPARRLRSWGWYSGTVARDEAVLLYETPSGEQVKATNVATGYEPVNPYRGWMDDAVFVGEVTKYVEIYKEGDTRKRMMKKEETYSGRRQWEFRG